MQYVPCIPSARVITTCSLNPEGIATYIVSLSNTKNRTERTTLDTAPSFSLLDDSCSHCQYLQRITVPTNGYCKTAPPRYCCLQPHPTILLQNSPTPTILLTVLGLQNSYSNTAAKQLEPLAKRVASTCL